MRDPEIWGLCEPDPLARLIHPDTGAPEDAPIEFTADSGELTSDLATLEGSVMVRQGDRELEASKVSLDRENRVITAEEGVSYGDTRLAVRSERAKIDIPNKTGVFEQGAYYMPERNAQGSAARVETNRETNQTRFEKVTYSTCPRGDEFWQLRTRILKTDEERKRGSARDVTLAFRDVPVLWLPYLSFPITDERQSGFLAPRAGFDSDNGFDLQVPYYWNIAPNYDATLAPRVMSNRGLMLAGETRFLFPKQSGEVDVELLPADQEFGDDRGSINVRHRSNFLPRFFTDTRLEYVSDDDYVEDFGNRIDLLTDTFIEQHFDARYFGDGWTALGRAQAFRTLDDEIFADDEPYDRLPQFRFDGRWPVRSFGLSYEMHGEVVNFERDDGPTGWRFDVQPGFELSLERPWGFVKPRASYRYTAYSLQDTEPGQSDSPDRGAPILSLDSGLYFERPFRWRKYDAIQTLEPRLFYLYIPDRDQDNIPLFDTTEIDRSFPWLFLENRFTGGDRLGDANQLTAALTTRLFQANDGREWFRFSVGEIFFFEDRQVTLTGAGPEKEEKSEIIAESRLILNSGFSIRGEMQWDVEESSTRRGILDFRYHPEDDRLVNFGYRFARNDLEQLDMAVIWPFRPHWQTFARWNWSLKESKNLEAFVGFGYESCCWALRAMVRNHRDSPDDNADNSFFIELELKGLGGLGGDITERLEESIIGFEGRRY